MHALRLWFFAPAANWNLFRAFIRQDIQKRFAGSMGGLFWTVITPVTHILVYIFVFSTVLKVRVVPHEQGTDQFVVYLLAGLLPWLAFAECLSRSPTVVVSRAGLIKKVSFPLQILPFTNTLVPYILNGIGFAAFLGFLVLQGQVDTAWLALPLLIVLHIAFSLGLMAVLSALAVFIRDIQQFMSVIVRLWFYTTPIIYPITMVPDAYARFLKLNPMYPFIAQYRGILLQHVVSWDLMAYSAVLAVVTFTVGGWFFMRIKHAFGDVL